MVDNYKKKDKHAPISSFIGQGDVFKGEFNLTGAVKVDGTLKGDLTTNSSINISRYGNGNGSLRAKNIFISGEFIGDLYAVELVVLKSTAFVRGNITSAYLVIEDGAYYSGICKVNNIIEDFLTDTQEDNNEIPEITDLKKKQKALQRKEKNLAGI